MGITNKQILEIEDLDRFVGNRWKNSVVGMERLCPGTHNDINGISPEEAYFLKTSQGITKPTNNKKRLLQLLCAQKWRLRMMAEYEDGLLKGSTTWFCLFGFEEEKPINKIGAKFMARTLFKGRLKEDMMEFYECETEKPFSYITKLLNSPKP